jgi:hypothetical protein
MTEQQPVNTGIRLTKEDRIVLEKAKKIISSSQRGVGVSIADAIRASLYFFVETKEAEKSAKLVEK